MTDTLNPTLNLTPDALTLVRVTDDYNDWPASALAGDDRIFYAASSTFDPDNYGTVLVPDDEDRSRGMWYVGADVASTLGLEGPHRGWNVPHRYLEPVTNLLTEEQALEQAYRPASADMSADDRKALPVAEAYPVGSRWTHVSYPDDPVTVLGSTSGGTYLSVRQDNDRPDREPREWYRGALDYYGTFVGWAEEHTPAPSSSEPSSLPETFTREEVDRLVREARAAERQEAEQALERWKHHANGIAVQYAEENDLCGNFEACMSDIGLMGREEWHAAHDPVHRIVFEIYVDERVDLDEEDIDEVTANVRSRVWAALPAWLDGSLSAEPVRVTTPEEEE